MLTNKLKKKITSEELSKDLKESTKAGLDFISTTLNLVEDKNYEIEIPFGVSFFYKLLLT